MADPINAFWQQLVDGALPGTLKIDVGRNHVAAIDKTIWKEQAARTTIVIGRGSNLPAGYTFETLQRDYHLLSRTGARVDQYIYEPVTVGTYEQRSVGGVPTSLALDQL